MSQRPAAMAWAGALLLLAGAFLFDIVSGNEVSSSLFYVAGIAVAAWCVGERTAIAFALMSTVAWGLAVGDLQREMLPPGLPELPGYAWQVRYTTSTHAGGDYYDFFPLPDGRLGVLIGDASGHGPQAAVLMAMMRVLLRTADGPLSPPQRVLERLGGQIARTVPSGRFATACYLVLEPASGRVDYSLAGHPPPLLVRADGGGLEALPLRGGPPLGLCVDRPFEAGTVTLGPGDTLALYTDGLTEGMGPTRELFGDERLRAALGGGGHAPLVTLCDRVMDRLGAHRAGVPLEDDLTLLMVRRMA